MSKNFTLRHKMGKKATKKGVPRKGDSLLYMVICEITSCVLGVDDAHELDAQRIPLASQGEHGERA